MLACYRPAHGRGATMARYYSKDPRWLVARYPGRCKCGAEVKRGDRVFYWPIGKHVECSSCGAVSSERFELEAQDEAIYSGSW